MEATAIIRHSVILMLTAVTLPALGQLRVEDVKSPGDVIRFLKVNYFKSSTTDTAISFFPDTSGDNYPAVDSNVIRYFYSGQYEGWVKSDLNHDGKQDLVFSGFFNQAMKILAFVSKENSYTAFLLSPRYVDSDTYPLMKLYDANRSQLVVGRINPWYFADTSHYHFSDRLELDTLSFQDGRFIDHNFGTQRYRIDTLKFSYNVRSRGYKIILADRTTAFLSLLEPAEDGGQYFEYNQYRFEGDPKMLTDIWNHIDRIPLTTYNYHYVEMNPVFDGETFRTEWIIAGKTVFRIYDRVRLGPVALQELYVLVERLKAAKGWKFVKHVNDQ
jgi:hypothetical protein